MSILRLYHGSDVLVQNPGLNAGNVHNDFGRGFYCTQAADDIFAIDILRRRLTNTDEGIQRIIS